MVSMMQGLNARSFFVHPKLSLTKFSALAFKVCRYRFGCHGCSVAEPFSSKMYTFGHLLNNS
jgi:hypothetical protein